MKSQTNLQATGLVVPACDGRDRRKNRSFVVKQRDQTESPIFPVNQRDGSDGTERGRREKKREKKEESASSPMARKKSFKEKEHGALMCEKHSLSHFHFLQFF